MFYVMNMNLPCCLISLLAMLSFYIPADSGQKTGLSITVLLSMSVFLLILSDQMPLTSNYLLIGYYYYSGVILIITLSTEFSVLTVGLHHNADVFYLKVPEWLKNLCFNKLAKPLCLKLRDVTNSNQTSEGRLKNCPTLTHNKITPASEEPCKLSAHGSVTDNSTGQNNWRRLSDILEEILAVLKKREGRRSRDDEQRHTADEWRRVALIMDRVLLVILFSISVTFTLIMLSCRQTIII